ncbi:MAG: hypothetical protein K1X91_00005 [Bacteriodetes bacterium]|nr:hypothetical protein [Bacteroidota bacterium]
MVSSGGSIVEAGALTNGQLLIGSTGAAPVAATLTGGTGISISNNAGSITINSTASQISNGTTTNSTLRWNGTNWVENTSLLATATGSVTVGGNSQAGTMLLSDGSVSAKTATIGVATLGANRIYTIPESGNNASFVMTEGTQTINGSKTFGSTLTITPFSSAGVVKNNASGVLSSGTVSLSSASEVSGVLPIANGGTNSSTALNNNRIMVSSGGSIVEAVALTNGQLLIGSTGAAPVAASLTAGAGITITPGAGTITVSSSIASVGAGTTNNSTLRYNLATSQWVENTNIQTSAGVLTLGSNSNAGSIVINDGQATSKTATLSLANLAANRVYTIPESGNNASFVMTEGTQTINGSKTFGSTLTITPFSSAGVVKNNASGVLSSGQVTLTTDVTGVLPIANGGTNSSTALNNNRIMVSSGGSIVEAGALTNGQLLIGSTGAAPVAATLTGGTGISISNNAGSITINSTASQISNGTTTNSTLRWNGTNWVENTSLLATATGSVTVGGNSQAGTMLLSDGSVSAKTATIGVATLGANRIYTIPEAGNNASFVMTEGTQTINGSKSFTSNVLLTNSGTATELRLYEPSASGNNYTAFKASGQLADITYTLPTSAPTVNQILSSDASGNLSWVTPSTVATALPLSGLTAATATNSINSADYAQTWAWNTLSSNSALTLSSTSTAAASNTQTLLNISMSGANATATQTTYGMQIANTHTGTTSTNIGLSVSASGGTNNYALVVPNGNVGIGTSSPALPLHVVNTGSQLRLAYDATNYTSFTAMNNGNFGINPTGGLTSFTGMVSTSNTLMVSSGGANITGNSTVTGTFGVGGHVSLTNSGSASELRFYEPSAGGTEYSAFKAGTQSANLTYTLPTVAPTANQVLSSDASGNLSWATPSTTATALPLSGLTAATATNSINSADYAQTWAWNTLSSNSALTLSSTSTAAASNTQKILNISLSGANATASQTTYGQYTTNTHTGTSSTNIAGYFSASGGTVNYGIVVPSGEVGIGTATPGYGLEVDKATFYFHTGATPYMYGANSGTVAIGFSSAAASTLGVGGNTSIGYSYASIAAPTDGLIVKGTTGIGTSSPSQKLHVAGNILVDTSAASTAGKIIFNNPARTFATSFKAGAQTIDVDYTLPTSAPNAGNVLSSTAAGVLSWVDPAAVANAWSLSGNSGTNSTTNFLGTTDNTDLVIKVNNTKSGLINIAQYNVTLGYESGLNLSSGSYNTFYGAGAGKTNTTQGVNTYVGHEAGRDINAGGGYNTIMGAGAGKLSTTLGTSVFIGANTGGSATGNNATYVGAYAGRNSTADNNTLLGYNAGYYNTTGANNTLVGTSAGQGPSSNAHSNNTMLGYRTGYGVTSGSNNILVGYQSGDALTTGSNNIVIGYDIDAPSGTSSNQLSIGNIIYGTSVNGSGTIISTGNIGIGTNAPSQRLHVAGNILVDTSAASTAGKIIFNNPARTFATSFKAGAQTVNLDYTLPTTAPTANQVLSSDASGNLSWATPSTTATALPLSGLTAATATNSINSADYAQTWAWNSLGSTSALTLSTTSTAAASNTQTLLNISMSGANASATQTTYGMQIANTHTGTSSTNVGLSVSASGGTNNYALVIPSGNVGIGTTTPTRALDVSGTFNATGAATLGSTLGVTGATTLSSTLGVTGITTFDNSIKIREGGASPTFYTTFQGGDQSANLTYTLPTTAPTANQVLSSDASGNLSWATPSTTATSLPLSGLTAATATNSINSADFAQIWAWNTLSSNSALTLSSTSTAAASNTQKLLNISLSGANGTASQTTYGQYTTNTHTGTTSTNVAGYFSASGGTNNYGLIVASGYVGIGTTIPTVTLHNITTDAATATTTIGETVGHNSSGTPATSFGVGTKYTLQSSTTADQDAAQISTIWTTATHASRTSALTFSTVTSAAALSETMRITNGQVGINTTSLTSGSTLDVKGHIALSNGGTASELRFYEPSGSGSNYTAFKAQAQAADITYTLPAADATVSGQVLSSNAAGTLSWVTPSTTATALPLSGLTAATATNSINSADFAQTWAWNTLSSNSALTLSSTSTAAASNTQTLLNITMSGANATASQTTYGAQISNTHTGTTNTNVGLSITASGATNNYALVIPSGYVGVGTSAPATSVDVDGAVSMRPGTASITTDNQAVTVSNRSFLRLTSNSTPANRTITLSNGLQDGQVLYIRIDGSGTSTNGVEIADSGNCNLSGLAQILDGGVIQLIWDSSATKWFEVTRSNN